MRLSLCLLTWNELAGCKSDVPLLPLDQFEEVYAVDGGSVDGTVEYLESCGIKVFQQQQRGYNAAYICAFRNCSTDAVVIFQPKGTIDPATVLSFRPLLEAGKELVIASRLLPEGRNEEDDRLIKPRKWFVAALSFASAAIWKQKGQSVTDVLHGFRAMRKSAFFDLQPRQYGLTIDLEMVIRSYQMSLAVSEFPVSERPRAHGDTHFPAFATGRRLLAYFFSELFRQQKPVYNQRMVSASSDARDSSDIGTL